MTTTDTTNERLAALHARRASRQGEAVNTGQQDSTEPKLFGRAAAEQDREQIRRNRSIVTEPVKAPEPEVIPEDEKPPRDMPKWALRLLWERNARITELEKEVNQLKMVIMEASMADRRENQNALVLSNEQALMNLERQVALSPRFKGLNEQEIEYVAVTSLNTGLNPDYHIHAWITEKKDPKTGVVERLLNTCVDYKGLIATSTGIDKYRSLEARRLTADEMRSRGIPEQDVIEGSIAYVVELTEWTAALMAKAAGGKYEPAHGFGWWPAKKEQWKKGVQGVKERVANDVPNGRDGAWVAEKRAMRDLYNKLADLRPNFVKKMFPAAGSNGEDGLSIGTLVSKMIEGQMDSLLDGTFDDVPAAGITLDQEPPVIVTVEEQPEITKADWLNQPEIVAAFEKLLVDQGVTFAEINEYIGHDWKESALDRDQMRVKVLDLVAKRAAAPDVEEGEFTETAGEPAAPEQTTAEASASTKCSVEGCELPIDDTDPERRGMCFMHASAETTVKDAKK